MSYASNYIKNYQKRNIETDENFIKWINSVENIIKYKLQMNLLDIPDEDYMFNFENNIMPEEMAQIILIQYK
jgi:hypothetical protein